ncbi:hypothetical protein RhiirA1_541027 [Rhizophagus irregularis]|uniref:Kelch-like protein 17 n=1 Tax=Rhizophagus irregularis TaxID=588596 RepID=A0A2N0R5D6_9GLOM|nr:hypothetical protein RhiirA1_541027 [Rhizophagus irregularis]
MELLPKLSQNLLEILDDDEYYDITIEVGNDPYVKVFHAHMVILNYRSPYLRRILSTNEKKNDGTLMNIKLSNISPESFQIILRYIYGGKLLLDECDTFDIIKILITASELSLQELIPRLQSFLINNKRLEHVLKWGIAQNPGLSSDPSSYSNDDFDALKNTLQRCIPFIKFIKFSSKEFLNKVYPYKMIIPVMLYENLIQWFLNNDYNPSNRLDPRMVKEIICKMNNNDYKPNSKLELQTVSHKINNNHNASSKSEFQTIKGINIDSKIITIQHAELISEWVDKLEIEDKVDKMKNFYEFKLIFRGSRDGFTPKRFHEICDNQSHTVAIIKVKDSNEILGGYNPIAWKSLFSYGTTDDSFIFSFRNKNINDHIISRVNVKVSAINYWPRYGPSFGNRDLILFGGDVNDFRQKYNYCKKRSYEKNIRETEGVFSVEEYEVFQIIKKN